MKQFFLRTIAASALFAICLPSFAQVDKAWDVSFASGGNQTICYDVAAEAGNTYGAGFVQNPNNTGIVVAYNSTGAKIWERSIGTSTIFHKVLVAGAFVYACGYTSVNGFDGTVVKLDKATGVPSATWSDTGSGVGVRRFGNNVSQSFNAMVAVGSNLYLAGYYEVGPSNLDAVIVKYDANGNLSSTWSDTGLGIGVRSLAGSAGGVDIANDITADSAGNLYATGKVVSTGTGIDGFAWKLSLANGVASGTWPSVGDGAGLRTFSTAGSDNGLAITMRGTAVVVVGVEGTDAVALEYSGHGVNTWTHIQAGTGNQAFSHVAVHDAGLYVIGRDDDTGLIVNLSNTGDPQTWHGNVDIGINHFNAEPGLSVFNVVVDPVTNAPYFAGTVSLLGGSPYVALYSVDDNQPDVVNFTRINGTTLNAGGVAMDADGRASMITTAYTGPASTLITRYGRAADYFPTEYTVVEGSEFSGGLAELLANDNEYLSAFNDDTSGGATMELRAYLPPAQRTPLKLQVWTESAVGRSGISEAFSVMNFTQNTFQLRWQGAAHLGDHQTLTTNSTTPDRDINDADGQVKVRFHWQPINDEDPSQDGWLHRLDYVRWRVIY